MIVGIDPVGGASGNMFLGALADLGVDMEKIFKVVERYVPGEFSYRIESDEKFKLYGKKVVIETPPERGHRRTFKIIREMIASTDFPERVKELAERIFFLIAEAEAKIHARGIDQVHFHETGAIDSIVDIFSFALGWDELGFPPAVLLRKIPLGEGYGVSQHGPIPFPAPATVEILRGLPVLYLDDLDKETVTPTGAAIIKALSPAEIPFSGVVERSGLGVGDFDFENIPNILRLVLFREDGGEKELIWRLEANIDDMTPELLADAQNRLLEAGALDVYLYPASMKKGRPGYKLEVLVAPGDRARIVDMIFSLTSTIGLREELVWRRILPRQRVVVETEFGKVRFKKVLLQGRERLIPEFEEIRRIATEKDLSPYDVYTRLLGN